MLGDIFSGDTIGSDFYINIIIILVSTLTTLYARKKKPGNYAVAMTLSVMWGATSQFYLRKSGLGWVLLCLSVSWAVETLYGTLAAYLAQGVLSALLMHCRMRKMAREKAGQPAGNVILR